MTTKEETLRRIAIMQAWCDGEPTEYRCSDIGIWTPNSASPLWDWTLHEYRIAPKPKRKVKFLGWFDGENLFRLCENATPRFPSKRVPSLDLEAEVDD